MPKKADELKAIQVKALSKTVGRHAVGGAKGLYLLVAGEQAKSWVLRVKIGDRRRDIGLGSFDDVSLGDARERAMQFRKQVLSGIDPLEERERARAKARDEQAKRKTFRECAEAVIELKKVELKNAKHLAQWRSTLETYVYPSFGDKPVGTITEDDVEAVLTPIWQTKHETASRLRGRVESVFDYAKSKKLREGDNPAAWKGNLRERLGKVRVQARHQPALPHAQIGAFMVDLRKRQATAARALEFAILTATRSGEVLGATWAEIDLDAKLWTIPEGRMKKEKEHEVPLSDAAVALLKALPRVKLDKDKPDYLFPAARGGKLSDMALSMLVRRMNGEKPVYVDRRSGDSVVPHGFRSTFRDWAGDSGRFDRQVIEHALAHSLPDATERAYHRSTLLPRRIELMEAWAVRCASPDTTNGNVVGIRQGAAA